jgi:hypothetical protein
MSNSSLKYAIITRFYTDLSLHHINAYNLYPGLIVKLKSIYVYGNAPLDSDNLVNATL